MGCYEGGHERALYLKNASTGNGYVVSISDHSDSCAYLLTFTGICSASHALVKSKLQQKDFCNNSVLLF